MRTWAAGTPPTYKQTLAGTKKCPPVCQGVQKSPTVGAQTLVWLVVWMWRGILITVTCAVLQLDLYIEDLDKTNRASTVNIDQAMSSFIDASY